MLQRNLPRHFPQLRQPGQRPRQGDEKPAVNGGPRRRQIPLKIVHRPAHLPGVLLPQYPKYRRVRFPRVKDDGQPQAFRQVNVRAEYLLLRPVVGRFGQIVQPHLGDADHPGVVPRQRFQPGVHRIVHRVAGVHRVDAHPGVKHRMRVGQGDAALRGLNSRAGQQDAAHAGVLRPLQDGGDFVRGELFVLVQVGMGVAVNGRCGHRGGLPESRSPAKRFRWRV